MKILSIIPARKGSKDIKNKNLVKFKGKPLIFHSIRVSKKIKSITTFVSTDSKKILQYAKKKGIQFNYLRPKFLAKDKSNVIDAVFHALKWFKERKVNFDAILLLQPTSPLRTSEDILAALKIAQHEDVTSVIGVCEVVDSHPQKLKTISGNRLKSYVGQTFQQVRSQDLSPTVYRTNGAIYLTRRDIIMERQEFYGEQPAPLIMPPDRSIDIDTEFDFYMASQIMARKFEGKPTC